MKIQILFFLYLLAFGSIKAQISLTPFKKISVEGKMITADKTGNVFLVKKNNELLKLNEKGDSLGVYSNVFNGSLQLIDASNPLKILLFYPTFSKLIFLDKLMSVKNEISLQDANIKNVSAVAQSIQNRVWIFDNYQSKLVLLDEQMQVVMQTNNIKQELKESLNISCIAEGDWKVFLCDQQKGIFVFDYAGNYINILSIYTNKITIHGGRLFYLQQDTVYTWDKIQSNKPLLKLPKGKTKIVDAIILDKVLLVLYEDELVFFQINKID